MFRKKFLKSLLISFFLLIFSAFGFSTAFGYGGGGGSSSGGGAFSPDCSSVTYGAWGPNINGFQYRDVVSQFPPNCSLSTSQQLARSRDYVVESITPGDDASEDDATTVETPTSDPDKQVLGEKIYAEGTLIKGSDNRIYVVIGESIYHIKSLQELSKYRGPVLNVGDDVIESFSKIDHKPTVLGEKMYADGTLIRYMGDPRIYVIVNGEKQHIRNLAELRQYAGKEILTVSDGAPEVLGEKTYADGTLLRGSDKKIYVLRNGKLIHIRNLVELSKYQGQKIHDVSDSVINGYQK
jgi:hypothetical protein